MTSGTIRDMPLSEGMDISNGLRKRLKISSRQIVLLSALDEFRSLGRAAAAMNTTQPAASLLLQQLEERLGVKLFERRQRGMEPTVYGEVMIRYARSVVHDFSHAEAELADLAKGASGCVRIGSVMGPIPDLLSRWLLAFKRGNPRVRISVDVGTSDTLLPKLIQGDLDMILGRLPDQFDSEGLAIDFFEGGEGMCVIARPGHPLCTREKIELPELFDSTWILRPTGSPMRLWIEAALKTTRMTSTLDVVETSSLLLTTSMIEASDMISVVPRDVAQHFAKYGMVAILPVELPISMSNLAVVTRKSKSLSPSVLMLLECIRAETRRSPSPAKER